MRCGYCEKKFEDVEIGKEIMEKWKIGITREAYGRILERRHVAIKKMMKEVARELPVGSQNGLLYGELVEGLEESLTDLEAQLHGLR